MKKIFTSVAALAFTLIMALSSIGAYAKSNVATDYFVTTLSSRQDTVTVMVDVIRRSEITSGQFVVAYDPSVLELDWALYNDSLALDDINIEEDGIVSYAFVSDTPLKASERFVTLSFKAKNAYNGEKVTIATKVTDAYQNRVAMELPGAEEGTLTLKLPKPTSFWGRHEAANNARNSIYNALTRWFYNITGFFW